MKSLTGQAFVRILCVLVHRVIWDSVLRDGLHLHSGSMGQHPQVFKQPLPEQSRTHKADAFRELHLNNYHQINLYMDTEIFVKSDTAVL